MDKRIQAIDIVFENTEIMSFEVNEINFLFMGNISRTIAYENGYQSEGQTCEDILIRLKPEANKRYLPLDIADLETTKFRRLRQVKDIVAIDIHYNAVDHDFIYAYWEDQDDVYGENNRFQKVNMNKDKELIISISKENCK